MIASVTMALIPTILSTNYAFAQARDDVASDKNPRKSNPITGPPVVGEKGPVLNPQNKPIGSTQTTTTTTTESCTTRGGQTPSGLEPQDGACRDNAENENAPQHESTTTACTQRFNMNDKEQGEPTCITTTP
jgi:hypothetical protein